MLQHNDFFGHAAAGLDAVAFVGDSAAVLDAAVFAIAFADFGALRALRRSALGMALILEDTISTSSS